MLWSCCFALACTDKRGQKLHQLTWFPQLNDSLLRESSHKNKTLSSFAHRQLVPNLWKTTHDFNKMQKLLFFILGLSSFQKRKRTISIFLRTHVFPFQAFWSHTLHLWGTNHLFQVLKYHIHLCIYEADTLQSDKLGWYENEWYQIRCHFWKKKKKTH